MKKVKYYEIYQQIGNSGNVVRFIQFVESKEVAKAICKNNDSYIYLELEAEVRVDED